MELDAKNTIPQDLHHVFPMISVLILSCQQFPDGFSLSLYLSALQAFPNQLHSSVYCCFPPTIISVAAKQHNHHTHHCHLLTQQLLHLNKFLTDLVHCYISQCPECSHIDWTHQFIVVCLPQLFPSLWNKHNGHTHHCHPPTQQLLHFNNFLMDYHCC